MNGKPNLLRWTWEDLKEQWWRGSTKKEKFAVSVRMYKWIKLRQQRGEAYTNQVQSVVYSIGGLSGWLILVAHLPVYIVVIFVSIIVPLSFYFNHILGKADIQHGMMKYEIGINNEQNQELMEILKTVNEIKKEVVKEKDFFK